MSPPERPRTGRETSPEREREALLKEATNRLMEERLHEWKAGPEGRSRAAIDAAFGTGMLQKLRGMYDRNVVKGPDGKNPIQRASAALEASMDGISAESSTRLTEICERLEAAPPASLSEDDASGDHPYLTARTVAPVATDPDEPSDAATVYHYHVNDGAVKADIDFLKSARGAFADGTSQAAALDDLILRLEAYRMLDPKIAMQEKVKQVYGGKTYMDLAGREMGRVALTGIALAGTVIFGTIALVNFIRKGEISATPFLWGFATWLVADPAILNSFFSSDDPIRKDFEQIRRLTDNKGLTSLANRYGIGGEGWAKAIDGIYAGDHGAILDAPTPTPEAVARAAKDLAGKDAAVENAIATMLTTVDATTGKSHFAQLVEILDTVDREEAREFVRTYVATDSVRKGMALDASLGRDLRRAGAARRRRRGA